MRIYIPIFEIKLWACYESKWEGMFIQNQYFGFKKLNRLCSFKFIKRINFQKMKGDSRKYHYPRYQISIGTLMIDTNNCPLLFKRDIK